MKGRGYVRILNAEEKKNLVHYTQWHIIEAQECVQGCTAWAFSNCISRLFYKNMRNKFLLKKGPEKMQNHLHFWSKPVFGRYLVLEMAAKLTHFNFGKFPKYIIEESYPSPYQKKWLGAPPSAPNFPCLWARLVSGWSAGCIMEARQNPSHL